MEQSNTNYSTLFLKLFKILLAAAAFYFVYLKVVNQFNANQYLSELKVAFSQQSSFVYLLIVCFLMFFNWLTEAWKWQIMILKLQDISLRRSLEAVLSGLTVSLFTPNRIGEYAGRVFHLDKADKVQATLVTVVENFSQLLITLLFGSLATVFFFNKYAIFPSSISFAISLMLLIVTLVSMIAFFNIRLLDKPLSRIKWFKKKSEMFHVLSEYTTQDLLKVMAGALIRYFIFTLQFYLLIIMYGGQIVFSESMMMIALTYLVITIIPTFLLTEIGVRGATALYFFSKVTNDSVPILNAVFSLWLINLALPALIGAILMVDFNFGKIKPQ